MLTFLANLTHLGDGIHDYAKDGGEELFTKMHCVRMMNL